MRSCHQGVCWMAFRQVCEVFQSSRMSWSSKIIMLGSVENNQRISAGDHDSM